MNAAPPKRREERRQHSPRGESSTTPKEDGNAAPPKAAPLKRERERKQHHSKGGGRTTTLLSSTLHLSSPAWFTLTAFNLVKSCKKKSYQFSKWGAAAPALLLFLLRVVLLGLLLPSVVLPHSSSSVGWWLLSPLSLWDCLYCWFLLILCYIVSKVQNAQPRTRKSRREESSTTQKQRGEGSSTKEEQLAPHQRRLFHQKEEKGRQHFPEGGFPHLPFSPFRLLFPFFLRCLVGLHPWWSQNTKVSNFNQIVFFLTVYAVMFFGILLFHCPIFSCFLLFFIMFLLLMFVFVFPFCFIFSFVCKKRFFVECFFSLCLNFFSVLIGLPFFFKKCSKS